MWTVLYFVYCCVVNCVLLTVRSVVGCPNSITAASIEPWLAQLQTTFQLDEKYCTAKWVKYLGRKIVRNSVLYIPCAEGPLFYLIYEIIINIKSRFILLIKQLNECYFVAHTQAFKICDVTNFEYINSTLRYECDETFSDECEFAARAEGEWCNHTCQESVFRTSIVRNFISRGVKMRISAREACVKPHLQTRSEINIIFWWSSILNYYLHK